jgi:hypothetical protein
MAITGLSVTSTKAETTDGSVSASSISRPVDINDPAYLQSIGLMRAEAEHGIPVTPEPNQTSVNPKTSNLGRVRPFDASLIDQSGSEEGGDPRTTCLTVYKNMTGGNNVAFILAGTNFLDGDDCTMGTGTTNRFVCSVTTFIGSFGGIQPFTLRCQIWAPFAVSGGGPCPDNGSSLVAEVLHTQVATGFHNEIFTFAEILVPNTVLIGLRTPNATDPVAGVGPAWVGEGPLTDAGDVGTSADAFYSESADDVGNGDCADNLFFFGGCASQFGCANFGIEIIASEGPTGSCCNQTTGVCTANVLLTNCSAFGQRFSLAVCPQTPPCAICDKNCTGATVIEGEPNCAANYIDNTNNGCSFTEGSQSFINVNCGADICGKFGTYTFLNGTVTENRRDNDYYRLTLTSTQRVTWTVNAESVANAIIFIPAGAGACDNLLAPNGAGDVGSNSSSSSCSDAIATACLPAGTYYLVARPAAFTGIPCGVDYRATVACVPCTLPTGACCKPNGTCVVQTAIQCAQQLGVYRGDGASCTGANCPLPPTNETCIAKTTVPAITTNTTVNYDTTFAVTEDSTTVVTGCGSDPEAAIFKDIWYDYKLVAVNQPAGVTNGRIAVSTYESCYDTKVAIYRVFNCNATQASQCAGIELVACNDDMNLPGNNLASYVEANTNGDEENPTSPAIGECYKIRVGGPTSTDGGSGFLRVDYLPSLPAPWSSSSGRCCFPNGSCQIYPADGTCQTAGGFLTSVIDIGEGDGAPQLSSVGCHTIPCPAAGEACFNALNLHSNIGPVGILGTGFGTTTRAITNKLYYRYQIPAGVQPGSGLTISTCGSSFNTAIAVYSDFDQDNGQCTGQTPIATNDNCAPADGTSAGAQGIASCFASGESDSCLCLTVGTIGQPTGPGSVLYIEIGATNTIGGANPLPSIDPVPENCGTAVTASLTVTASAACFVCNIPCPGGSFIENEPVCGLNYVDTTNVGCNADVTPIFQNITCGTTICGEAGTYVFFNGTTSNDTRDLDWYRLVLTTGKKINVSLTAAFPAALFIVEDATPATPCASTPTLASTTSEAGCLLTTLSADACAGTFYIVVGPANFDGVTCGSDYNMTVACDPAAVANCCKGDMNNDGKVNGLDIAGFVNVVLHPLTGPFPLTGCYNLNTCRADFTNDTIVTTADIPGFVAALLVTGNCPAVATCSDPARCHLPDQAGGNTSDLNPITGCNVRVADDFKVDVAGNVSSVCWYGFYVNLGGGTVCSPQGGSGDNFSVTLYNDNAGVPGTVKAGPFGGLTITKTNTGTTLNLDGIGIVNEFKYETTITSTALTANTCYWIEIVNSTTGVCCWVWETGGFANDVSASRNGGPAGSATYVAADVGTGDMAFCLNDIRINKRDCGLPQGRCCIVSGITTTCQTTDVFNCVNVLGGGWTQGLNCISNPCPTGDECFNATVIACGGTHTVNMPTDGYSSNPTDPSSSCEIANGGPFGHDASWWYSFTPNFTGTVKVSMCSSNSSLDSVMTIFTAGGVCGSLVEKACDDDFCTNPSFGPSCLTTSVVSGQNYKILVDHYSPAQAGAYTISITCPGATCP